MRMLALQFFGFIVSVFFIYLTWMKLKRKELDLREAIFWYSVWVVLFLTSAFPQYIEAVKPILHIDRVLDLLFVLCTLFLFGLLFIVYCATSKSLKRIEVLERVLYENL